MNLWYSIKIQNLFVMISILRDLYYRQLFCAYPYIYTYFWTFLTNMIWPISFNRWKFTSHRLVFLTLWKNAISSKHITFNIVLWFPKFPPSLKLSAVDSNNHSNLFMMDGALHRHFRQVYQVDWLHLKMNYTWHAKKRKSEDWTFLVGKHVLKFHIRTSFVYDFYKQINI